MSEVLAGAVAGLRMLVDGTIAVTLHFEPKDRTAAMQMLGEPGAMVGVVRLKDGTDAKAGPKTDPRGPLCMDAIGRCNNPEFQAFCARHGSQYKGGSDGAKRYLLDACVIDSRKQLDTDPAAKERFAEVLRRYREWLIGAPK